MQKATNPTDREVGQRIRAARLAAGFSQEKLGCALGVTFQQVQKYEKGANRVGASRMVQIATALQVPVPELFGINTAEQANPHARSMLATRDGQALAQAFNCITDLNDRHILVMLAQRFAAISDGVCITPDFAIKFELPQQAAE